MKSRLLLLSALLAALPLCAQTPPLPAGVKARRDLPYVENGHERQKLDLFLPEKADGPCPIIVWVHGGAWQAGSKEGAPPLRQGYVQRGYAVASINYRLSSHAVFPAQIEDCKAAVRWLRAHAAEHGLDGERIGVWGSSAGGHLVALLGTSGGFKDFDVGANLDHSSAVQAVCDFFGPTDLVAFVTRPGYASHASATSPEAKLLGGVVLENREKAARANPITYADAGDPPFLIVHGDQDSTVPIQQSELLFAALEKAGVSAHFHTIRGAGHGGPGFGGKTLDNMVAAFFDERLKGRVTRIDARKTDSPAEAAPAAGPRSIPWEAIARRDDRNQDGRVTREEFSGPPQLFQRLDRNGDGTLTREEHEAR
jgi:acetyl esterase/lipase